MLQALRVLEVLLYIHAVVEYADHNNLGFSAGSVKNDMATLAKLFVSWFYIFCIAAVVFRRRPHHLTGCNAWCAYGS